METEEVHSSAQMGASEQSGGKSLRDTMDRGQLRSGFLTNMPLSFCMVPFQLSTWSLHSSSEAFAVSVPSVAMHHSLMPPGHQL